MKGAGRGAEEASTERSTEVDAYKDIEAPESPSDS